MEHIDRIAIEDDLIDSFIHNHAKQLFLHCNPFTNQEYIAKICYWLASNLDPLYEGECAFELIPAWNKQLSLLENNRLKEEAERNAVRTSMNILMACNGNLLHPNSASTLIRRDGLICDENLKQIGSGSYGETYLVDCHAVKIVPYKSLDIALSSLIRETTALSILGRLHFIGMNKIYYYVGMEYYPNELLYDTPKETMMQLLSELKYLHSHNIVHCDIKLDNIRTDSNGNARLIDFGCCRFTPAVNANTYIGAAPFRDYLLLKCDTADYSYEIDIWSLGIVLYILETRRCPWSFGLSPEKEYYMIIEHQWGSAMEGLSDLVRSMLSLTKENRYTI